MEHYQKSRLQFSHQNLLQQKALHLQKLSFLYVFFHQAIKFMKKSHLVKHLPDPQSGSPNSTFSCNLSTPSKQTNPIVHFVAVDATNQTVTSPCWQGSLQH